MNDNLFRSQTRPPGSPPVDLSEFDEAYEAAEAVDTSEVPDGRYIVEVQSATVTTGQSGDSLLKWDLLIIEGEHSGRHLFKNSVITNASLPYIKGELDILGIDPQPFSALAEYIKDAVGARLEVAKRLRGDYVNIYINKRLPDPVDREAG